MKMVTKFKVCTPKPDADLCMRVDLLLDKKNCGKSGLGHRTAGPSWSVGRWAVAARGPLGRGPAFSKTRVRML